MSKWTWMQESRRDAQAKGDRERLRMMRVGDEAWGYRESDPARAQALYEEGLRRARQLGEPWWEMYFAQRRLQALMLWRYCYGDALGLAVESALDARKPQYASYPHLFDVYFHLVMAYVGVDPAGYAAEIGQAIDSLERDVPRFDSDGFLIEFAKREFALWVNDLEAAEQSAWRALRLAEEGVSRGTADYFLAFVYADLCAVDFKRADTEALAEHAAVGEEKARQSGQQLQISECQLWQALLARQAGDEARAHALRLSAVARVNRLKQPPVQRWFDALCAWSLYENDLPAALDVRDQELGAIVGHGQLAYEVYCHVERCRLLAMMGWPLDEGMAAAREAAGKLKNPAPRLAELDAIARGERGPGP